MSENHIIQATLEQIERDVNRFYGLGKPASYIPALEEINTRQFALTLIDEDKKVFSVGDDTTPFTIQSVSKVFTLMLALNKVDDEVWGRMEREPSGKAFDSLIHLEENKGIPSNPFINSGAIVIADILLSEYGVNAINVYLDLLKRVTGNNSLFIDDKIFNSEKKYGHKNYSFAHYMKSYNNIECEVNDVLDLYFRFCSLNLSNRDLCHAFYFLMNKGISLQGERITTYRHCKRINSLMFTSGTYNEVGDFAYLVGLPLKSGVSGAIAGCLPNKYSVSVWSPELNKKGNSYLGFKALEMLTTLLDSSYLS